MADYSNQRGSCFLSTICSLKYDMTITKNKIYGYLVFINDGILNIDLFDKAKSQIFLVSKYYISDIGSHITYII